MHYSILFTSCIFFFLASLTSHAGQLDIAVIQFSDKRDTNAIVTALHEVDLLKITDSDRTETNVLGLRGGNVLFVQSIDVPSEGHFANSTRLTNQRADVTGTLTGSLLSVQISILEGVKVGLRKHRETIYSGSGSVANRIPQLISVKQSSQKTQTNIKGRSKMITYEFTSIIVARYLP